MIIQGSNNPLVIQFDASVSDMPKLIVTLWNDRDGYPNKLLKSWDETQMTISDDTVVCPLDEAETKEYPHGRLIIEAKGLDSNMNTIFWDQYPLDVKERRDKIIRLTQAEQTEG